MIRKLGEKLFIIVMNHNDTKKRINTGIPE